MTPESRAAGVPSFTQTIKDPRTALPCLASTVAAAAARGCEGAREAGKIAGHTQREERAATREHEVLKVSSQSV